MDFAAQLRLLEEAQGHPAKLALTAVDLAFPAAPDSERDVLKEALVAATIPHWCNTEILAALLDLTPTESARRFALLERLNEVEAFEARGEGAINIHEAARLALRKHIAREQPERFRSLSARAATYFANENTPIGRIEWIYHRLSAAPDEGAAECEALSRTWDQSSAPQDRDALAITLHELETTGLVVGRARLQVLLYFAWNQEEHSEIAQVVECAPVALELAKEIGDVNCEASAYSLLGEALREQGHLQKALDAHQSALRIYRDLAVAQPLELFVQWRLAVAYGKLGDIYQDKGALDEAFQYYRDCSEILKKLVENEPTNPRWWRESAAALIRLSDILRVQGAWADARKLIGVGQTLIRQLVAAEPANEDWRNDLARTQHRIAQMYDAEHAQEAREALEEYLRFCRDRLSHDPDDIQRLRDVALGYGSLASIELAEGHFEASLSALAESRVILKALLARSPDIVDLHVGLALNLSKLGFTLWQQGQTVEARLAAQRALDLWRDLSTRDPADLHRQRDLALAHFNLATIESAMTELKADAIAHYEEASRLYAALVSAAPERTELVEEQKRTDEALATARGSAERTAP